MPIYEYACMKCEHHFEELVRMGEDAKKCPHCSSSNVVKQLSVFTAHGSTPQPSFGGGGGGCCGGGCGCS